VLKGVSFCVAPGQEIALVGHTGAGKTTIVNLLLRFYEPQRGRILVNGVDIRTLPVDVLRAVIGYVQQDIFLFAGDVAGNLRLDADIDDATLAASAARVGADKVIARLPGGWHHELAERGGGVSVGERQLLAFARAVAADPALLILDEATSAVDSHIEAEIQRAVSELMRGRTTIAIAHRLSTIVDADEILVLHHGEVVERGTHRELLRREGLYDRLFRLQVGERDASDAERRGAFPAVESPSVGSTDLSGELSADLSAGSATRLPTDATPGELRFSAPRSSRHPRSDLFLSTCSYPSPPAQMLGAFGQATKTAFMRTPIRSEGSLSLRMAWEVTPPAKWPVRWQCRSLRATSPMSAT
jgi:ABC-type multidrug transport system ATPase subunit